MKQHMKPVENRNYQYNPDIQQLRDRFRFGMLSQLQGLPQWVVWRGELEEGKRKKVPYNPNYHFLARASVKIPKSWGTLQQALTALETGNYSGIGFMITPPLVLIDIDHSFDRATQTITKPHAVEIMRAVPTFYERSPNDGIHGLVYVDRSIKSLHTDELEIYGRDRFTTISTDHIAGTPTTIENRTEEVHALYQQFSPPAIEETSIQNTVGGVGSGNALTALPEEAANDPLLQQLLEGDTTGFQSPSNADFVLVLKLLHWTGDNVALTRKIFLESGLYREGKTERKTGNTTYIDLTIQNAIRKRRNPPQRR